MKSNTAYVVSMLTIAGSIIHEAYSRKPIPNQLDTIIFMGLLITSPPTRLATYRTAK